VELRDLRRQRLRLDGAIVPGAAVVALVDAPPTATMKKYKVVVSHPALGVLEMLATADSAGNAIAMVVHRALANVGHEVLIDKALIEHAVLVRVEACDPPLDGQRPD
jgi:hypothetical protein